jgi:hypothetical protein
MKDMTNRYAFFGGNAGTWRVLRLEAVRGPGLEPVECLDVRPAAFESAPAGDAQWTLYGLISNVRYATRPEVTELRRKQEPLGRSGARALP